MKPFSCASSVQFCGLHLCKEVRGSYVVETRLEHPRLAFISGKERWKPAALHGTGATWTAGHTQRVSPRSFDQGGVSATGSNEAVCQLCYLGSCPGENMSLEEASSFISILAV